MIGYIITAAVAMSFGTVLGGILASSKVSYLYQRLRVAEENLLKQASVVDGLVVSIRHMLDVVESRMSNSISAEAAKSVHNALLECDATLKMMKH